MSRDDIHSCLFCKILQEDKMEAVQTDKCIICGVCGIIKYIWH
jgi:hypothetical protein